MQYKNIIIMQQTVELTNVQPTLTAVQTVTPVRDFFSAQQLVSVPAPGLYTVAVEAAFVDEKGQLWHTGPRSCIVIKVSSDTTRTCGTWIQGYQRCVTRHSHGDIKD